MKVENKRIFISDLPEIAAPAELEKAIQNYGNVTSVEIKERKELGPKNNSLFFSYVNVEVDDKRLQQCFKDFANGKYFGERIYLQLARESFLDRLKREREQLDVSQKSLNVSNCSNIQKLNTDINVTSALKQEKIKKYVSTDSESEESGSSSSEEEQKVATLPKQLIKNNVTVKEENDHKDTNETLDLVIKSNKGKTVDRNGLKIESVGKSPIITIDKSKQKTVVNSSEANLKRLESLNNLKKTHKAQKSLIQQALSKVDNKSNNKIVFDETEKSFEKETSNKSKKSLFDDEPQEEEFEPNFEVKEQFQGEKGQKLLELQARYKNDKRFALDARFLEENNEEGTENHTENTNELSLEEEKKKEYEILEEVLGKKVMPKQKIDSGSNQKKIMLRFDPTQPEHSKFELKIEGKKEKKKRKRENSESDIVQEKKREEPEAPEVSKDIFYKVTDDLKDSLKEKEEFSLLRMFGKAEDKEQYVEEGAKEIGSRTNNFVKERNPFRYDSSDDEDETEDIPTNEEQQQVEKPSEVNQVKSSNRNIWHEPFFFTEDDYRLQEGIDFVERMSTKEDNDFTKVRRDLKEIVKAKVRNNQRKNRPFKKKLGGSKRKKMLRIKKALKR